MATYVTREEIEGEIPPPVLRESLDDDGDGVEDEGMLDRIIEMASRQVDAALGPVGPVPTDPVPAYAREAARVFACEMLLSRHGVVPNRFSDRAKHWRDLLTLIAQGKLSPGTALTEPGAVTSDMDIDDRVR